MKTIYRITMQFTEPHFKNVPPTNLFISDESETGNEDEAREFAESLFKEAQVKAGVAGAPFKTEVRKVSQEEMDEYKRNMALGNKTHQLLQ